MPRLDVAPDYRLLVQVLRDPTLVQSLSPAQWNRVLDAADHARLSGWLVARVDRRVRDAAPEWLNDRVLSALSAVAEDDRSVLWETDRLRRAFTDSDVKWVLLKGAAYLAAGLPPGHGRRVADIDVLVSERDLSAAEAMLKRRGWDFLTLDPYDERFYREWMHELPPMIHRERHSVVDLHHAILPRTGRLHPETNRLLDFSIEVKPGIRVLSPPHMVLHAAAHLFHDGEISGAIRDVVDMDGLLRWFANDRQFWSQLTRESIELGLTRPAYYALRYTERILKTPIPGEVRAAAAAWAPPAPVRSLMDFLVERTLTRSGAIGSHASTLALYIRSHWLRMPPLMLARHLTRKALRSR